ncbi:MAG: hypothetical protein ACR2NN_08150 [Bryobacteraceae bacterium]
MSDYEKEEFWKALGRLYDSILELRKTTEEFGKEFGKRTEALLKVAELHQQELESHEKRIEWLAEQERRREKGGLQ